MSMNEAVEQTISIISNVIRTKLALSDIKKKDVAYQTGLSVNTINNCLSGKNVNISSVLKIAYSLGMNFTDIADAMSSDKTNIVPVSENKVRSVSIEKVSEVKDETGASIEQLSWRMGISDEETDTLQNALSSTPEPTSTASDDEGDSDILDMLSM
jgi:lambda repressor-like predicted transcriptional regulator